jgi:hypothetical protein
VHVEKNRIKVTAWGSCREKQRILAVTVVLLLGEKSDLSCYCGATAGKREKNRILAVTVLLLLGEKARF